MLMHTLNAKSLLESLRSAAAAGDAKAAWMLRLLRQSLN